MSKVTPRKVPSRSTPITSEAEREQALRDYKLTIEYKHLKQHSPSGVYLLPSTSSLRLYHGVIFLRRGLYSDAVFKFTMELPEEYNDVNTWPRITFSQWVYNPHVTENNELDVQRVYTKWDPHRHYLVTVLTYLKKVFYMKAFGDNAVANKEALELSRNNPAGYRKMVEKCVKESQRGMFINEPNSSLKFKQENEMHVALRELMVDRLQDPTMVTRSIVLNCVKEAQKIGSERIKAASEKKEKEGADEGSDEKLAAAAEN
mmetsp:Transcript_6500/g.9519  ORF Transcript_6500/g.9519 Transcript_6500/m.9519 type:complete len:260 (+) Transcript_6500:169-948(+)